MVDDIARLRSAPEGEDLVFWEIGQRPDSFPCLVALAALRSGRTSFVEVPALRHKESDRIHAMAEVLRALEVPFEELPDGLTVSGPMPRHRELRRVPVPDDHRIVMSAAILGSTLRGGIELDHAEATGKSWPGFFDWLATVAEVTRVAESS